MIWWSCLDWHVSNDYVSGRSICWVGCTVLLLLFKVYEALFRVSTFFWVMIWLFHDDYPWVGCLLITTSELHSSSWYEGMRGDVLLGRWLLFARVSRKLYGCYCWSHVHVMMYSSTLRCCWKTETKGLLLFASSFLFDYRVNRMQVLVGWYWYLIIYFLREFHSYPLEDRFKIDVPVWWTTIMT